MERKSFIKGLAIGVIVTVMVVFAGGFLFLFSQTKNGMNKEDKIRTIEAYLNKFYVDEIDSNKLEEGMYSGMVESLGDPYTVYMSKTTLEEFESDNEGSFGGIGIEALPDKIYGGLRVVNTIEGYSAYRAGILQNDLIIKVNGEDVTSLSSDAIISKIKGEEGTTVNITIYRENFKEELNFDIVREIVQVSSIKYSMKDENICYIKMTQFRSNTYDQFKKAYDELKAQNMKGLIIDLRDNPGGLLNSVEEIADMLVPEGTMVYTIDKAGNREDYKSDANSIDIPLCLIVNGNSASASEIMAAAVQDMKVGKLVGTQTFGKGVVQGLFHLPDDTGLKITIQKYYTPNGICIQGEGITPDYIVELPEETREMMSLPEELDTQLQKAIEVVSSELN